MAHPKRVALATKPHGNCPAACSVGLILCPGPAWCWSEESGGSEQEGMDWMETKDAAVKGSGVTTDRGVPQVYKAIAEVIREIGMEGIQKTRKTTQGSCYQYRGVDDVLNVLNPLLHKHGLVIIPRVTARATAEGVSNSGGVLRFVALTVDYILASVADGSTVTATSSGEAFDGGDKATAKAFSMAYKYLCFQLFAIPIEGASHDNETDDDKPSGPFGPNPPGPKPAPAAATGPVGGGQKAPGVHPPAAQSAPPATPPAAKPPAAKGRALQPSPKAGPGDIRKLTDAIKIASAKTGQSIDDLTARVLKFSGKPTLADLTVREATAAQVKVTQLKGKAEPHPPATPDETAELREKISALIEDLDADRIDAIFQEANMIEPLMECENVSVLREALALAEKATSL